MADILKYRKLDGTEVEVANNSTIALDHTEASIEFTADLDQFGVLEGETRGWFALAPTLSVPQTSNVYGLTIAPNQGQTVSVTVQTVDAKNLDNLQNRVFTRFSDTFTVSVVRAAAPADSVADSNPINFLTYPDSAAAIAIVNASFQLTDSATTFGIVDSPYIHQRQNRDFDFLINLPKSIDSAGITRSLFDSDVRKSISVTDVSGDGSLTYNNSTGIITYTGPSAAEVRAHLSAGGDLSYNQATGQFSFDVEQVYTKSNFDSDFNVSLDEAALGGFGLSYNSASNVLFIDSQEIDLFFKQHLRGHYSAVDAGGDGSFSYDSSRGRFTYTGPSASEVRSHFSAGGDLSYDSTTGVFQFDVEQVYTKSNFDSDFNLAMDDVVVKGDGLRYNTVTNELEIDSGELSSFFRQDIRGYISADKGLVYNSTTGNFDVDSTNLKTIISATDAGGDGSFSYNNSTGVFTYTGPSPSEVRSHFSAGGDLSYDSSTGRFQFDVEQVYTKANFDSDFNVAIDSATTSDLSEGTNLYYTTARADSAARSALIAVDAGGDGSFAYDSATGKFTYTGPSSTEVRNHFTGGTGIAISSGDIKIDSSELTSLYRQTIRTYLNVVDAGGDGSFAYDSTLGKFTYTGPSAGEVRAHLTANKGLSVSSGEFNIDSANVRGMFSGGTGVTYTSGSGVIAIGQPVATTDSVTFAGMTVSGNLQVNGTTTTVNSTTLDVADKNITIAKGAANAAAADGGGITVDGANATLTYAATGDKFVFNKPFEGSFLGGDSDFDARLATKTTTNLAEGNNLYYTTARADSAARSALIAVDAGGDGSFTYDSATGIFTYTGPSQSEIRTRIDDYLEGGNGIVYGSGTIDIDNTVVKTNSPQTIAGVKTFSDNAVFSGNIDVGGSFTTITTTGLNEGNNLYYTTARADSAFDASFALASTDSLSEGSSNLYYTNARADARVNLQTGANLDLSQKSTSDLSEGTNKYYTTTRVDSDFDASFALASTDSLSEGSTNLYFTNERVDDRVGALITGGVNVTATYDDAAGTLEIKVPFENIDDRVGNILTAGNGININYDDPNATITITNTLNTSDFTDSAFVTGLPISTFTNDKNYLDSTYAAALVDSAYIKAVVDSNYVQLIQADLQRDSAFISSIVTGGTLNMGANDIITTGKILYSNLYSTEGDLPSASTYHGMFAHVHGTGGAYFAHGGNWIRLVDYSNFATKFDAEAAGGSLLVNGNGSTGGVTIADGAITIRSGTGNPGQIDLYCEVNNAHRVRLKAPAHSNFSGNPDVVLPNTSGTIALTSDITATITQTYIRNNQIQYNTSDFTDSAFVTGLPVSTFTNDVKYLDSTTVTGVINSAYIQARQNLLDSDLTKQLVDSAYIAVRDRFSLIDSTLTTQLISSSYVQARQKLLDSSLTTQLIDSAYINARISSIDSAATLAIVDSSHIQARVPETFLSTIIDSAYVTARAGVVLDSASIASGVILTTVNNAYVQARQIQYNTSDFTDSTFVTGLPVSTFTNDVQYLDSTTVQGVINAAYVQANQNDYLDSTLTSQLIDSAYIALRTTSGTDSATVIGLIDSDYVSSRVVAFANPIFTEFKYITDSAGQIVFEGNDANGNALSIETGNHSVFVNGIRLLPSDFTSDVTNNRITLDSTGAAADEIVISTIKGKNALAGIAIIDSDYIASRTIAVAQPQFVNYKYNADGNQTEFGGGVADVNGQTVALSPGNFTVFLNGIRLLDSDFTANTSTNVVTLSSGATLNDELVIQTIIGQNAVAGVSAVDSAYVQLRVPASYIQANQTSFLDSSLTSQLIDSAYIALRTTSGTDSATVINLIDSDYVAARVTGVVTPQFTDFRYRADSGQTLFSGADLGGTSLNLRTNNFNAYLNGIKLIDSDFTANVANNTITLTEAADSGDDLVITTVEGDIIPSDATVIDSAYVQARQEGVNATFKDFKFVATANQTVFSGNDANGTALSFEANKFHVLLNGIRLDASDFTESAANNKITLATGATVSDELIVSTIGTEKTTTLASITSTVDSAYIQARQTTIDSAYIEPLLTPIHISGSNVGIGTGSPGHALTISANEYDGIQFQKDGTDNGYIGIGTSNLFVGAAGNLIFHTGNAGLTNGSERMRIDGNGRVLIGTTTLSAYSNRMLTVSGNNDATIEIRAASTSGHSQLVFSDGSAGDNSSQRGYIIYDHADETFKFGAYDNQFMHASTFGSTDGYSAGRLAVGYNNNAANSNNRTVGLHVGGHRYYHRAMMVEDYDPYTSQNSNFITFIRNGNDAGEIVSTGATSTSYSTSSDYRVKNNIQDMDSAINIVKGLKPRKFTFKAEDSDGHTGRWINGFIAHELDSDLPLSQGIVIGTKDQVDSNGKAVMQGMDYGLLTPILTKALQEALEKIETLEAKVAALEGGG